MNRFSRNDTVDRFTLRPDRHALPDQLLRIPATNTLNVDETVFVDMRNDHADLITMACKHDSHFRVEIDAENHVAMQVRLDIVSKLGCVLAYDILDRALDNHFWRQERAINLIPSEMTQSPLVRMLQVSDPVGRYAEHKELLAAFEQEVFYYQGTDFIAWVEEQVAREIILQVPGIVSVTYNITSKPPSTIEAI